MIRLRCLVIQAEWSPMERKRRSLGVAGKRGGRIKADHFVAWTVPKVKHHADSMHFG
jgi:hypothetical protein